MAESTSLVFKDFVGAEVWKHFLRSLCAKFAQCKVCKKVIKCDGGSTKGLHVHLKSNHQIDLLVKRKNSETHQEDSQEKRPKIATIEHFLNDTTLSAVLARMTEMEDSDGLTIVGTEQEDALELNFDISGIVGKVRRVSKLFKRSPLKDEILQNYVKEKHSNGLQLILDCKTRWSSLLNMLERIGEIQIPVQKALLDLNSDIKISDEEFGQISRIVHSLGPIKIAVEALCRRDANLITGEATLKFILDEMQNYPPSEYNDRIIEAIIQRSIQERYIEASKITAYLHNPLAKLEKKTVVREFCYTLLSRTSQYQEQDNQTGNEMDQLNSNSDKEVNTTETLPVAMKLQLAIDASLETPQEIPPSGDSLMSSLKFELNIAEHTGKRGILLEKVYQMLLTVPPTSVESERIFSSCAYFCNKFRSRLSDTTLNNLCLIRNNRK